MRVLIVEDDAKIAGFIAAGLRQEGHAAEIAADGVAGLALATQGAPTFDALVLDLLLPSLDGFGVLAALRQRGIPAPVLMLSALDSVDDRVRGLRAGADDYLVKPFAFDELLARLLALTRRRVAGAEGADEPTRLALADLSLDRLARRARRGADELDLQPREFALLEYLLGHAGRVVTRSMILREVCGLSFDPQTNVAEVMVYRLRHKVDQGREPKLIHTLRGLGYVLRVD